MVVDLHPLAALFYVIGQADQDLARLRAERSVGEGEVIVAVDGDSAVPVVLSEHGGQRAFSCVFNACENAAHVCSPLGFSRRRSRIYSQK